MIKVDRSSDTPTKPKVHTVGVNYRDYCPNGKMFIRVTFTQNFKFEYLRNNKCNGTKNIRCFPCCTEPNHSTQGFCGQPVLAHCTIIR